MGFPVIETPTLLLFGEGDPILVPATTDGAEEFVKNLTLRFIPDAGHWVQQEAPDEVNTIVGDWLTGSPVSGARRPQR